MPILNPKAVSHKDTVPPTDSFIALLPLTAVLPALATLFADRFSTAGWVVLIVVELALIATTSALAARAAARTDADRARRDAAVLDALEPLHGARK
ncbi:hypothetical protein OG625_40420 (plasmid) [Streptomyces sp. NBC_01351]|uniref:hypothetical protein n=1 Tax=Streptomyces sp. NBC_01351 TaxID=2903833 RepID=UPI002E2F5D87|nr:hypothetical protein [Streptomyces sp. NBC_01351]